MPDFIQRLIDNPVALVGVFRALAIFAAAQGVGWFSDDANVDATVNLLSLLLPFLSLLFTGASSKAHNAEVEAALLTPAPDTAAQASYDNGDYK